MDLHFLESRIEVEEILDARIERGHKYMIDVDHPIIRHSVTSILNYHPDSMPWVNQAACLRGKEVHKTLEMYLQGDKNYRISAGFEYHENVVTDLISKIEQLNLSKNLLIEQAFCAKCSIEIDQFRKFVFYVGLTPDLIDLDNGYIIDFKTGKYSTQNRHQVMMYHYFLNFRYKLEKPLLVYRNEIRDYSCDLKDGFEYMACQLFERNCRLILKKKYDKNPDKMVRYGLVDKRIIILNTPCRQLNLFDMMHSYH